MMSEATPGPKHDLKPLIPHSASPWHSEEVGTRSLEDGTEVAVFEIRNDSGDLIADGVDPWDAPVIAAAPSMLDALERLELMANAMDMNDMVQIARAAISKAEGELT